MQSACRTHFAFRKILIVRSSVAILLVGMGFHAGGAEITVSRVSAAPGGTVTAEIRYAAQGSQVTGLQFDLEHDPQLSLTGALGPAGTAAEKSLTTSDMGSGRKRLLVAGLNQNALADGIVVNVRISVPATMATGQYSLRITSAGASDKDGRTVAVSAVDGTVSIGGGSASVSAAGAMAQIASGGSWKTTITLINLSSSAGTARLNFWAGDGRELTLPLTFPQTGGPAPANSSSVERVIGAGGLLVIETEAPRTAETIAGWAELLASGDVTGFAIFRQRVAEGKDSEAVVFLESRPRSSFLLPFDNTPGFVTGLAVANLSPTSAAVAATITDESGAQIATESISLPPRGHTSFALTDRYRYLSGRRGTIDFRNTSGGTISVLGLRFNQFGSFTSIPAVIR